MEEKNTQKPVAALSGPDLLWTLVTYARNWDLIGAGFNGSVGNSPCDLCDATYSALQVKVN